MPASIEHRVVLFGGQGSPSIFLPCVAETAEDDSRSSSIGGILLSRCHAAFLEEVASLDPQSQRLLAIDVSSFSSPNQLLRPAEQYHTHPVLQATTIYLCQLLHYLAETHHDNQLQAYEHSFDTLGETAGFSSGILPAAVVARSRSLADIVTSGVEGFRLAFWIACRSLFWTLNTDVCDHPGEGIDEGADPEATLSLVIRGLSPAQVEERLSEHFTRNRSHGLPQSTRRLQISATSSSGAVSVTGPKVDLCAFRAQTVPDLTTTFAYVHGWYHGGDQLEGVAQQVLEDSRRRAISFPPAPAKPIRSTLDGALFDSSMSSSEDLLLWLARHLLVHCVNWNDTAQGVAASIRDLLDREPDTTVKVLSFGPSTNSILPDFQSRDSRIELLDLSSFRVHGKSGLPSDQQDSIAIVGMSVHLPKGKDTEELWDTMSRGLNAVREIPETRFKISDYYAEDSDNPRKMPARHGAFLDDPFSFDNSYFNISPREAKSMDPQQRVLLHAAQEAFEDAGYVADSSPSFQRESTGCYIGLATGDYTANLRDDIDVFYSSGTLRAFHSGRISYFYRLSGPSIVTDTACSSSMVSIYQACRALQNGDCTAAIAGGVNVITSPDMYLGLARGHFLSPSGGCKPFDASADGYCRAEGCVLFVLKKLSDAVAEGDRIHGVIRNVLVNQSGNSHSITHPHSQTQMELITRLLHQVNVNPASVGVVEAHGTGTQAGDAREVETLRAIFGPHHSTKKPLVISSIKGNVGHCEAASGAAGLAKLLIMLREKKIPVQAGLDKINPVFADLESSGLMIPRQTIPWAHPQRGPRRAVLNNFGAAGSNASLLLEEWVESSKSHPRNQISQMRSAYIFALSAKSEKALRSAVERYINFLEKTENRPLLRDICYTATARRQVYEHRISVACSSVNDLLTRLRVFKAVNSNPAQKVAATVFVFSGQGSLYKGMGEELFTTSPPFKATVERCDKIIRELGYPSILSMFSTNRGEINTWTDSEQIIIPQCTCVALEYALAQMFMSWGVMPDYVMGHSLGEYAALCVSGALSLEDTLRVVASRAGLMAQNCVAGATGMVACNLSPKKAEEMLSENPILTQLTVACLNGIDDCVVGGPLEQIELFQKDCKARRVKAKIIDVPYAFHTPAMDPILEPLQALGRSIRFSRPTIPVMSNVYGRLFEDGDLSSDYFALHARQPVRFSDGLLNLQSRVLDGTVFIEIGPHPTTLPMVRSSILSDSCTYLGTLRRGQDAWNSISEALAAISLLKVAVKWREVFNGTSARVTSLPGHLLEGSTFLTPFQESRQVLEQDPVTKPEPRIKTGFSLLPWLNMDASSDEELVLETDLAVLGPLISGHDVGGSPICPASVFHELAIEAAQIMLDPSKSQVLVASQMNFASPLIYVPSQESNIVMVRITKHGSGANFKVLSCPAGDDTKTLHCAGSVSAQHFQINDSRWIRDEATVSRQSRYFEGVGKGHSSTFRTKVLYEAIFTRVVRYSSEYQSLIYLDVADSNLEGIGSFKMPSAPQTGCLTQPVFTDTLLHAAGFIANLAINSSEVGICSGVESIEVAYQDIDYSESFKIYCSLLEIKGAILADAIALNSTGKVVAVIRGMEFKRLQLHAFQQALSRKSTPARPQQRAVAPTPLRIPTGVDTPPTSGDTMNSPTDPQGSDSDGTSHILRDIVMEVGGFSDQDIDYTKSLDELGIDSLMQIEIVAKLARRFPGQAGLSHHALSECETLGALGDMLSSIIPPSAELHEPARAPRRVSPRGPCQSIPAPSDVCPPEAAYNNLVTLHVSSRTEVPLCLIHDGSGQVGMYAWLRDNDRSTYAFFDPHFGSNRRPHHSINQMAEHYVSHLLKSKHSPLILGGWSFGGVVAFEAAQQLIARGFDVKGLVLIDSPSPVDHEPLPADVISIVVRPSGSGNNAALEDEFLSNASLLGSYQPRPSLQVNGKRLKTVMLRSRDVLDTESLCGVRYDWLSRQDTRTAAILAWEELVGGHVEVLPIPGNHFEPFLKDNVGDTAAQLWKACRYIEMSGEDGF